MTMQKWVNLMSIILDDFKGKGHCIIMDSTYMGDIKEWQINMVGTSQSNRVGADIKDIVDKMKVGAYESRMLEHKGKNLVVVVMAWADNAIVKMLSNYHSASVLDTEDELM